MVSAAAGGGNDLIARIVAEWDNTEDAKAEKEKQRQPLEVVQERMRKDITVAPISADVVDPKQGRAVQATIN